MKVQTEVRYDRRKDLVHHIRCHVDADCFYVSAERVRAEKYRSCPVGVLGNNGACVIAKCYELR